MTEADISEATLDTTVATHNTPDCLQARLDSLRLKLQSVAEHMLPVEGEGEALVRRGRLDRLDETLGSIALHHDFDGSESTATDTEPVFVLTPEQSQLIEDNFPVARHVANIFISRTPRHIDTSDLLGAATEGLIEAARNYNGELGIAFVTFAMPRIKGAVIDALRKDDFAPRSARLMKRVIDNTIPGLASRLRRSPTDAELARELSVPTDYISRTRYHTHYGTVVSLEADIDVPSTGDTTLSLADTIKSTREIDPAEMTAVTDERDTLAQAIDCLPDRLRFVVQSYYFEGLTLKQIGDVLGVTESRVSQIHTQACKRLRLIMLSNAVV